MDDAPQVALLLFLYMLQGIPMGLSFGSIPFLLQSKATYTQIGIFTFASYPYSLKLLWSPLVDALFFKSVGQRKSWIIPTQILAGILLVQKSYYIDNWIANPAHIKFLTGIFFLLILLVATQDIAVDGWALTLLSKKNLAYASTCQTAGLNTGYFLSFTIFLALNSPDFCNTYLRSAPQETGVILLSGYTKFWGYAFIISSIALFFLKKEDVVPHKLSDDLGAIKAVYRHLWQLIKLPHMRQLVSMLLVCKIGFAAADAMVALKFLEAGFPKESMALLVLIDFPFEILFAVLAGRWSAAESPLKPWLGAYSFRLALAAIGPLLVFIFPRHVSPLPAWTFFLILGYSLASSFMSTIMFVSQGSFFARIGDSSIGGTYSTLLNTVANLGGSWPKSIVLFLVDRITTSQCIASGTVLVDIGSCVSEDGKAACSSAGGSCDILVDGFYIIASVCFVCGILVFLFLSRTVAQLHKVRDVEWKPTAVTHSPGA